MLTKLLAGTSLVVVALAAAGWSSVSETEVQVALEDVPAAVLNAVRAKFPDARLLEAERETEDGQTAYEIEIDNDGQELEVEISTTGDILEIEADDGGDSCQGR
jgi:hypothetical protein